MLDRKLARDLYRSRGLLLAITCIIVVGVSVFVAMQSSYHNLNAAKHRYYREGRMADFWIDVKKVPLAETERLAQIPGVIDLEPRIIWSATIDLPGVTKPLNSLVVSMPDRRRTVINDIVLRSGSYFCPQRDNEVILNDAFASAHRLTPGDRIHVLMNNRRQELIIVGTAISCEYTYLLGPGSVLPDPKSFAIFYVKRLFAEDVFDFEGAANQVVGRVEAGATDRIRLITKRAEAVLEPFGVINTTPRDQQISNQFITNEIDGLGSTATVIPGVFLAVAALILNVLITRLARQQRTTIGTLKAVGYADWQVFLHFLKFGLSVGFAGGLLGLAGGYLMSTGMTHEYRKFFAFPDLRSEIHWHVFLMGMAVSLLCAVAGSVNGAVLMLRLRPAEAMRPEPPKQGRAVWLERIHIFWQQLSAGWRMTLRGVIRRWFRTSTAIFAALAGASLLVSGFMMLETWDYMIDFQFYRVSRSDIDLALSDHQSETAWDEARQLIGVDRAEPVFAVGCTFVNGHYQKKAGITGLLPDARLTMPRDRAGRPLKLPEVGLVVTKRLAELLHVQVGDPVRIVPTIGLRKPADARIGRISDSYFGIAAYADIHYLSRLLDEQLAVSSIQLQTDQNPEHAKQLFRELKQMPAVQAVTTREDLVRNLTDTIKANQLVFIVVLVGFAGVMFFGSIVNASLVGLSERQREVATLRAIGYTPWQVGGMFLRETMLTNAVGTLLGLPGGYALMQLAALGYNQNDLIRIPVVTAPWIWTTTIALATLFVVTAHAVVQIRIHRMDFLEALKVKE